MKKLMLFMFLSLFSLGATAQSYSTSQYPVYERVYEHPSRVCHDVYVEPRANVGGAIVGAVIGYAIGREIDHHNRHPYVGYVGGIRHVPGYGPHYTDRLHRYRGVYEPRTGRYSGAAVGAVIGANTGRAGTVTQVCDQQSAGFYREVLVGYRVVTRYPNGVTRERFIPVR